MPGDTAWCRVEGLTARQASGLAAAMRRSGGSAGPAAVRRVSAGLARLGAPDPGRAVVLQGDGAAFADLLSRAPRIAPELAPEIGAALDAAAAQPGPLRLRDGAALPSGRTLVMGILNVTPDSFSDGGRFASRRAALRHAARLADEGADIIDVGGESTRPGSAPVPLVEELRRVLPVVEAIAGAPARRSGGRVLVSIDTTKSEVARRAAIAGADLINDISGMTFDPAMPAIAAEYRLPVILQHISGHPATMQRAPRYGLLLPEIAAYLRAAEARARRAGVAADRIAVDAGLGFGKTARHSLALMRRLRVLRSLGRPILVGASRKSFLPGARELAAADRIEASLAAEALALSGGADIIRAHDARGAVRVARVCDAVLRGFSGIG
ncbi:MAG TPA: dihydropteroate synthase [Patescibacteria group bacterium]|nr:dihydropteroate synthase [Patescibacteria group bacterium]